MVVEIYLKIRKKMTIYINVYFLHSKKFKLNFYFLI